MKGTNKKNVKKEDLEHLSYQLFASFLPGFTLLEVTLKNRLFQAIKNNLGEDWFNQQLVSAEKDNLFNQEKKLILLRKRKTFTLSDNGLLVESGLGLWVEFFNRPLYKQTKGVPISIFKNLPAAMKRKDIYIRLLKIKDLRNRLFHSRIPPITATGQVTLLNMILLTAKEIEEVLTWLGGLPAKITSIKGIISKGEKLRKWIEL